MVTLLVAMVTLISVSNDHGISGKMIKASYMQPSEYSKKFEGSEYLRDKLDRWNLTRILIICFVIQSGYDFELFNILYTFKLKVKTPLYYHWIFIAADFAAQTVPALCMGLQYMVSVELPRLNVNSESKEVILSDILSTIGTIFNNPISIKLHLTCGYFVQLATNHRPHSNIIAVRIRIIQIQTVHSNWV